MPYDISKKYTNTKLFSKVVFVDKDGYVILRGDDEYKFNDNIKNTLLKDIYEEKKE